MESNNVLEVDNVVLQPSESNPVPIGQTIQRNYVLNDIGALKKKIRHESRKDPYNQGTEARDGSNMVLLFKTSFFEYLKYNFINDLVKASGIDNVHNVIGAKVNSESSGEAFVEFSLEN